LFSCLSFPAGNSDHRGRRGGRDSRLLFHGFLVHHRIPSRAIVLHFSAVAAAVESSGDPTQDQSFMQSSRAIPKGNSRSIGCSILLTNKDGVPWLLRRELLAGSYALGICAQRSVCSDQFLFCSPVVCLQNAVENRVPKAPTNAIQYVFFYTEH
jgi:hypothetical protein